jgi:hypothetical protein
MMNATDRKIGFTSDASVKFVRTGVGVNGKETITRASKNTW